MNLASRLLESAALGALVAGVLTLAGVGGWLEVGALSVVVGVVSGVQEATGLSMMRVVRRLPTR